MIYIYLVTIIGMKENETSVHVEGNEGPGSGNSDKGSMSDDRCDSIPIDILKVKLDEIHFWHKLNLQAQSDMKTWATQIILASGFAISIFVLAFDFITPLVWDKQNGVYYAGFIIAGMVSLIISIVSASEKIIKSKSNNDEPEKILKEIFNADYTKKYLDTKFMNKYKDYFIEQSKKTNLKNIRTWSVNLSFLSSGFILFGLVIFIRLFTLLVGA